MYHAEVQDDKALEMKNASRCILQFKILFSIPEGGGEVQKDKSQGGDDVGGSIRRRRVKDWNTKKKVRDEEQEQKEKRKIKEKERDEKKEEQHIGEICVAVLQWKQ